MKKEYVKPFFVAEEYEFSSSIAKCDLDIDTTGPLTIVCGETNMCSNGTDGHVYGGATGNGCQNKGILHDKYGHVNNTTIFNDGADNDGCHYDWDGRKNEVFQAGNADFANSFYGNSATESNHAPGYEGQAFLS